MTTSPTPPPAPPGKLTRQQVVDLYFMEHRAKVLDLAAFLDRAERAPGAAADVRMPVLLQAIAILTDGRPDRTRRVLELMSDPSLEPIAKAGVKGAIGVWPETSMPTKEHRA